MSFGSCLFAADKIIPGVIRLNGSKCVYELTQHPLLLDGTVVFQVRFLSSISNCQRELCQAGSCELFLRHCS